MKLWKYTAITITVLVGLFILLQIGGTCQVKTAPVEEATTQPKTLSEQIAAFIPKPATTPDVQVAYEYPIPPVVPGPPIQPTRVEDMTADELNRWYGGTEAFKADVDAYLHYGDIENGKMVDSIGYQVLVDYGKAFVQNDLAHMPDKTLEVPQRKAAEIVYDGYRWDQWLALRGATASKYYGHGVEYVHYLWDRGRSWENCLACLECESTFGLGGSIDFGILYGNYPNTVAGYCDLLDMLKCGNDPWKQAYAWNEPGGDRYASGFCQIAKTISSYWP